MVDGIFRLIIVCVIFGTILSWVTLKTKQTSGSKWMGRNTFQKINEHNNQIQSSKIFQSTTKLSAQVDGYEVVSIGKFHSIEFEVAGKMMKFETGKIGRQANGAVVASVGETSIYSTVCKEREAQAVDFTPLRVDFFNRYSSVGQTIGAFHRRDSRGDDNEILVARLIDRPIRPMIREGWQYDTQILAWVVSYDKTHPTEALAINAASAAMSLSEVPMVRPVAGVEVGLVDGELVVNPTKQQMKNSTLSLTLAGTKSGILMIEGASDFLTEELMVEALTLGHKAIGEICDGLEAFQKVAGKVKLVDNLRKIPSNLVDSMDELFGARLILALQTADKHKRGKNVSMVEADIVARFVKELAPVEATKSKNLLDKRDGSEIDIDDTKDENKNSGAPAVALREDEDDSVDVVEVDAAATTRENIIEDEASELSNNISKPKVGSLGDNLAGYGYDPVDVKIAMKKLLVRKLREMILVTGLRSDGRRVDEVRPIESDTKVLPIPHGSSLFTRGETQALCTATLGGKSMEARYETLDELAAKRFYLQYRFPPSSVGEVGRVGGINRREVGHGNLAERALLPTIPNIVDFPYTIRTESLITESCGSSSMATVCGCCLAMLDAGVPLKTSVAGVAMGLILGDKAGDEPVILTDILGLEDALGTMDFKIAGNETGITTFQLDIKSEGLTLPILEKALLQAKEGRLVILENMRNTLATARALKDSIPKILTMSVPPSALGKVIGPKGKTVQTLIETYGITNINLEDDGEIQIESFSNETNYKVKEAIEKLVEEAASSDKKREDRNGGAGGKGNKTEPEGPPPEVGIIYRNCSIKGVHAFGVFVEVLPGYEGLVHISELDTKKVSNVESTYTPGETMDVKFLGKNEKGQMRLSRRAVILRDSSPDLSNSGDVLSGATPSTTPQPPTPAAPKVTIASIAEDVY